MNPWVASAVVGAWMFFGAETSAADRFVGAVEGFSGAARIAVIADGDRWLVYVCGESGLINETASRWWKGAAGENGFGAAEEGVDLSARRDGDKVIGTVRTADGENHSFTASKVPASSRAGAYRATTKGKQGNHVLSWIVDTDGLVLGCNKGGGKRVALKPAKLPPPKPVARRKPKPADDAEGEAEEQGEKPAVKRVAKAPAKDADEAEAEEDAKPEASADGDDDGEKVVGKKVTAVAPAKAKKPAVDSDDEKDDDETPAKKPAKKKQADDDDG